MEIGFIIIWVSSVIGILLFFILIKLKKMLAADEKPIIQVYYSEHLFDKVENVTSDFKKNRLVKINNILSLLLRLSLASMMTGIIFTFI